MPDIVERKRSSSVQVIGGGSDDEEYIAKVSPIQDLLTGDILDNGGLDTELTVGISAVEGKVGGSVKSDRKYVIFQALNTGITFGFSNSTQNIPCQKYRCFMLPLGENTEIWFIADEADKKVAFGEF